MASAVEITCAQVLMLVLCITMALAMPAAAAGKGGSSLRDRIDDVQQEVESLTEDIEDLREPVAEFELFDQCAYTIGVSEYGTWNGDIGYLFAGRAGQQRRRPALAIDMRGFGVSQFDFLAFPAEEPPSIECNEDAGEEFIDE